MAGWWSNIGGLARPPLCKMYCVSQAIYSHISHANCSFLFATYRPRGKPFLIGCGKVWCMLCYFTLLWSPAEDEEGSLIWIQTRLWQEKTANSLLAMHACLPHKPSIFNNIPNKKALNLIIFKSFFNTEASSLQTPIFGNIMMVYNESLFDNRVVVRSY